MPKNRDMRYLQRLVDDLNLQLASTQNALVEQEASTKFWRDKWKKANTALDAIFDALAEHDGSATP